MLKTYSTKGNTNIIPFSVKTPVSTFSFIAEFKGGDAFGLTGKTRRATYKTKDQMEQFAIESSEMFKNGLVTLDEAVETQQEIEAKARAAARAEREKEQALEEMGLDDDEPAEKKAKPKTKR